MSARTEVLLWAQRIVSRNNAPAHQILELSAQATLEQAQDAFHKIARVAHPDLHRTTLTPEELELVTTAFSRAAAAYQEFRGQTAQTTRIRALKSDQIDPIPRTRTPASGQPVVGRTRTPVSGQPVVSPRSTVPPGAAGSPPRSTTPPASGTIPSNAFPPEPSATGTAAPPGAMNSKAMIYYRKAEQCLRRGELKTAVLQLKMAIAADPQSAFLREAMIEIQAELARNPG